jgi:NADH-quinone oxidoreductase subunit C
MTRTEILADITTRFKDEITVVLDRSPKRVYIDIHPRALTKIVWYVFRELKARFNIASGLDARDHMEILYHFAFEDADLIVSFRVKLDKANLEIDSLAPIFEGANWIEREIHEVLGINFKGHPDLRRLLLPEEWPDGVYPLRRDYQEWDKDAIRDRGV